ncbi:response regulator receiver domain-containing protein [Vibrio crassostreae]|uniref:response regulator n=1 Tax=Vibrio crassostreae TaxID=246167 RepID=UPI000F46D055|nr:response regulator [Vibrio crassostreae]ROO75907.1 response regulator receiver domain-containing protein [Vibrio crassostreae]ROP13914.1 response regulator receiver domain-containing protein [Vibrio crassostreae]RPE94848.1 response regulator receiver domain-containing protein [Vibrio crassostreae]RPF17587.1 response regulator receiver domain-containing protein [Vibrio crassostreae]
MKILIIEDNEHKRGKVCSFIRSIDENIELKEAFSFNSGVKSVLNEPLDLIILDMSLPTHDKSAIESGGRFRVYGGKDIVRKMKRKSIETPFVILTQYSNFGEGDGRKDLIDIEKELEKTLPTQYISTIHYETSSHFWKEKLQRVIKELND